MSAFEASQISLWLKRVIATQDQEIDCEELSVTIEVVVEAAARGEDVRQVLPAISHHMDQCPDCREWFETLVELTGLQDNA